MRMLLWLVWSAAWIAGLKTMAWIGWIIPRSFGSMIFECLVCCFAAWFVTKHKGWRVLVIIFLVASLLLNFNIVGVYCFIMSIILLIVTAKTERRD